MIRTTITKLERAVEEELAIHLLSLPEHFYKGILNGEITPDKAKRVLPPDFHEFIEALAGSNEALNKITEEDARKFFEKLNQQALTLKEVKQQLLKNFRNLA